MLRRRIAGIVLAVGVSGCWVFGGLSLGAPGVAQAGDEGVQTPAQREEAKQRYLRGVELFGEGDYRAALIEFKKSYELVPNFNVLYNIGQTHFQLQDYAGALKTLTQYLEDGGRRITASRRTEVETDVQKLKSRVANVTITVNVKGADVLVDDVKVGTSPLSGTVLVSAGRRKFDATKAGYRATPKVEEIAGQEAREVALEMQPSTTVIREPGDKGDTRIVFVPGGREEPGPPVAPIVLWSLTGALAIGAGVVGGLALSSDSDLTSLKQEPGHTPVELDDAASSTRTLAIVTDVLLGASVVAAGLATYFTIDAVLNPPEEDKPAAPGAAPADDKPEPPAPTARFRLSPGFVGLTGTF